MNPLSGPDHWHERSEPNPSTSRVAQRHDSLHGVFGEPIAALEYLPPGLGDILFMGEVRRCVIEIVHCVVARTA